ncbi:TetR/AcrR family transcriptional regulator [Streptomyces sp. NPDC050560]|uniref:TetR/AcrR family transcriptional regulator n=1 Tax=Streptomyces sp. NPDC050560 TaxID=3365630 RepID=UPI00378CFB66
MRKLTPKGEATRQRIVAGAALLMRERGPANVCLDDIRATTATSKSQLFHYFPGGKSDLLLAVARYEAERVLAEQQPELGDLTDWRKWEAWRERVVEGYAAHPGECPLTALTAQLGLADPALREIVDDLYCRWQGYLAAGIEALKADGAADPAADPRAAAVDILTVIAGGATLLHATGRIDFLEVGLRRSLDTLRHGADRAGAEAA